MNHSEEIMKELPNVLAMNDIQKLVNKGDAMFFNYVGNLPNLSTKNLLKLISGTENVLVKSHLYSKEGNSDYGIHIKNWANTKEAREYAPFLLAMIGTMFILISPEQYIQAQRNEHIN